MHLLVTPTKRRVRTNINYTDRYNDGRSSVIPKLGKLFTADNTPFADVIRKIRIEIENFHFNFVIWQLKFENYI